jgi:hypothetical protein
MIDHLRSGLGRQAIRQEVDIGGSVVDAVIRAWEAADKPDDPTAVISALLERRRQRLACEASGVAMADHDAKIAEAKRLRAGPRTSAAMQSRSGWTSVPVGTQR